MLNTTIFYQKLSFVSGIDYLICRRKESEIIEDYSVILGYTKVICDYRKYSLMWFSCFALFILVHALEMLLIIGFAL